MNLRFDSLFVFSSVGKPTLSSTSATQYFINIDYPAVNILRKKGEAEKIIPVIAQPMRNPGQLMLDNIDNLSIQTLLDVIQPDGKEVDISVPSTSYRICKIKKILQILKKNV